MMPNNFNYKGHELFVAYIKDQFHLVHVKARPIVTSFLSLTQQEIIKQMIPSTLHYQFIGGFENAIRKVCILYEVEDEFLNPIICLCSKIDSRFRKISHRDILGTLMSLGLERDQIGDLVIYQDHLYIFCMPSIADYIKQSCTMIARNPVFLEEIENVDLPVVCFEKIQINCASTRLDAIVANLSHCSRKEAMNKIHHGLVKLNDVQLEENCQLCLNDIVSIHRSGKYIYRGIQATTKKNRLILQFDQFI